MVTKNKKIYLGKGLAMAMGGVDAYLRIDSEIGVDANILSGLKTAPLEFFFIESSSPWALVVTLKWFMFFTFLADSLKKVNSAQYDTARTLIPHSESGLWSLVPFWCGFGAGSGSYLFISRIRIRNLIRRFEL